LADYAKVLSLFLELSIGSLDQGEEGRVHSSRPTDAPDEPSTNKELQR
jgi:hypothetical protein